jgi:hypothetical protein
VAANGLTNKNITKPFLSNPRLERSIFSTQAVYIASTYLHRIKFKKRNVLVLFKSFLIAVTNVTNELKNNNKTMTKFVQ